jgi:dihydroxy-acid dehydratase
VTATHTLLEEGATTVETTDTGDRTPLGIRRGLTSYGDADFSLFIRGAYARGAGLTADDLARPTIGIAQTWSEFNPCHRHFREVAEAVKRGVWQAGGLPLEFPTISLGEIYLSPTSMLFRNLMAMDTEEMILAQPMDGVVLLGGCDKTLPAQLMGAASAGATRARASGPAPTAVASGASTGPGRSMRPGWRPCRASCSRRQAPAWSWAPPAPWRQ